MRTRFILALTLMLALPVNALAGGWQPGTAVTRVVHEGEDDGSRIYVMFASNPNPDACPNGNAGYVRVNGSTQKGKYIAATLLMAISAGRSVSPLVNGCDDWGRPMITGVFVD